MGRTGGTRNKMSRKEPSKEPPEEVQGSSSRVKQISINNLPPEMLTEILKCVDNRSLFSCRLVNRQWSVISSCILCTRTDNYVSFHFNGQRDESPWGQVEVKNNLKEFLQGMKNSKNCPYARFDFSYSNLPKELELFLHEDWVEFLADFAPSRIKGLKLQPICLSGIDVQVLAGKLRDLLLNKIPRLEEITLRIEGSRSQDEGPSDIQLFPTLMQTQIDTDTENSTAVPVGLPIPQFKFPQLPHLKSIRLFECYLISDHPGIVKDLLNAAINLKQLHVKVNKLENFAFLHSLGKLDLVKDVAINIEQTFFPTSMQNQQQNQPPLSNLEILNLSLGMDENDHITCASAASFIANLFESNKNTLTTMKIYSLTCGFRCLPNFQLPTFMNLKNLRLSLDSDAESHGFPSGSRARNIFPNVDSFDLQMGFWLYGVPQLEEDSIPIFPSVKTLSIKDCNFKADMIPILNLMCPNLNKFQIRKDDESEECYEAYNLSHLNFGLVARAIWTHMKQLEYLEVDVFVNLEENNPIALDSCFTGISVENCQRLGEVMEAKETLKKWNCQTKVLESDLTADREHPSILDMKELKKLTINSYLGDTLIDKKEFFTNKLTWISHEYAFKLMPHLKVTEAD